ncbi:UDP-4-amino-4-deoxy-L-arabinose--oxoglutarate aminotransferase [uncultured archaeon]|nr:UDP-4-amino-4-deoxy-L-arabinose--oxoglutarate aminotransferase [uncultured archaeon]
MKNKLAIKGGPKTINSKIAHYIWPNISTKTKKAVLNQLNKEISLYVRSGIIEKLETRLSSYFQTKHSLLTSSGTAALHSMYFGGDIQENDEVICPAYTHFATVTPLFQLGATPVLVDCEFDGNIDTSEIESKITQKTKAIVVTHMWGMPCKMDSIVKIARKYGLLLFEDASQAIGATFKGKKVGTFGQAAAFSLQAKKVVTGGEGGVLLTNNDEIYYKALLLGQPRRSEIEIPKPHPLHDYALTGMGLKYRIHPLAAAIANQQLDNLDYIMRNRQRVANKLVKELKHLPGIKTPLIQQESKPSWYSFVMQYDSSELDDLPISKFCEALKAEGCKEVSRPNFTPPLSHFALFQNPGKLFQSYAGKFSYTNKDFPKAERFYNNAIKLPCWYGTESKFVNLYIEAFKKVIDNYRELL